MKPTAPKKEICSYCQDFIVGKPFWIERPHRKVKGFQTYHCWAVDEGCFLLIESKGILDEVFGED
jgi:hypothetical protein